MGQGCRARLLAGVPALLALLAVQWIVAAHDGHRHEGTSPAPCASHRHTCATHAHRSCSSHSHSQAAAPASGESCAWRASGQDAAGHDPHTCPICQVAPTIVALPRLTIELVCGIRVPPKPVPEPAKPLLRRLPRPQSARGPPSVVVL